MRSLRLILLACIIECVGGCLGASCLAQTAAAAKNAVSAKVTPAKGSVAAPAAAKNAGSAKVTPAKAPVSAPPAAAKVAPAAAKVGPAAAPTVEKASARVPDATAIKPVLPPVETVDPSKYRMRRDPFVNPIVQQRAGAASSCSTGKRCLMIGQINLKGIIISPEGMLAIIENAANRTYFLRVNDPLYDGMVERITRDSITFRENVSDSLGRPLGTREVVKKIVAPAV